MIYYLLKFICIILFIILFVKIVNAQFFNKKDIIKILILIILFVINAIIVSLLN